MGWTGWIKLRKTVGNVEDNWSRVGRRREKRGSKNGGWINWEGWIETILIASGELERGIK